MQTSRISAQLVCLPSDFMKIFSASGSTSMHLTCVFVGDVHNMARCCEMIFMACIDGDGEFGL